MFSFQSEVLFHIGSFKITNTLIDTLLVDVLLVFFCVVISKNIKIIPGLFQNSVEMVIQMFYEITESVAQEKAKKIFPYFMSFFIFILLANWSGLLPGVNSIGFFENGKLVPILRSTTSDLNTTLGLALVSALATHIMSIKTVGLKDYMSRYFSFNPINLFIGFLEIISEITKIISLSFRLFGNIFAGEVVLLTVFSMLTMSFMAILTTPHHDTTINANSEKY